MIIAMDGKPIPPRSWACTAREKILGVHFTNFLLSHNREPMCYFSHGTDQLMLTTEILSQTFPDGMGILLMSINHYIACRLDQNVAGHPQNNIQWPSITLKKPQLRTMATISGLTPNPTQIQSTIGKPHFLLSSLIPLIVVTISLISPLDYWEID